MLKLSFENKIKEILVNKALDMGQASATSWMTVPKGTTAQLAAQARRVGALAYDTDQASFVVDDGNGFVPVGGSIGPNEIGASEIRLENDAYLRARNAADDNDIDILKVNTSDEVEFGGNIVRFNNGVSLGGFELSGLADPNSADSATNKAYVDNKTHITVRAMAIGNKNVNAPGTNFDGVTVSSGNLVLLTQQTNPAQNGVYQFGAGGGSPMSRFSGLNESSEFVQGRLVVVLEGNTYADSIWALQAAVPTVGTSAVTFQQIDSSPSGNNNTLSYFDASGALGSNAFAQFDPTLNSLSLGSPTQTGTTSATGATSVAFAVADGIGSAVNSSGSGSLIIGRAQDGGVITANNDGAIAAGVANASSSSATIDATATGAFAHGEATLDGVLEASDTGTEAAGSSTGTGSLISADTTGAKAYGRAGDGASLVASSTGAEAHGYSENAGSILEASGLGSEASGVTVAGSQITATNSGSKARGYVDNGGSIVANSPAASASGSVPALAGSIEASGDAAFANGYVLSDNSSFTVSGQGAAAFGGTNFQDMNVSGYCSFASGAGHIVSGQFAQAHGVGHTNAVQACTVIGRFASVSGSTNIWQATDPVLVMGNGTGVGSEAVGWRLDKDGRQQNTAAEIHQVRSVSDDDTVSARTDRTIMVDSTTNAVQLTLPAGVNGLEFIIKDISANASVNNITFVADGIETVESGINITTNGGSRHIQFYNGTWYIIASH